MLRSFHRKQPFLHGLPFEFGFFGLYLSNLNMKYAWITIRDSQERKTHKPNLMEKKHGEKKVMLTVFLGSSARITNIVSICLVCHLKRVMNDTSGSLRTNTSFNYIVKWSTEVYKYIHVHCMCKGNLIKYYIHIFISGL